MLRLPADKSHLQPMPFPMMVVGAGPDAFIYHQGHHPNVAATGMFDLRFAAPSRNADNCRWFSNTYRLPAANVGVDYKKVVGNALDTHGDQLVVLITTETGVHAEQIEGFARLGVKNAVTDKPMVTSIAECERVTEILGQTGMRLYVTFNHRYTAGAFQLRELISAANPKDVRVTSWSRQDWLATNPNCRQGDWRLAHPWCGPLDILTHAVDLGEFVCNSPIVAVSNGAFGTEGKHGATTFDWGKVDWRTQSGIGGHSDCCQARPDLDHADDIGVLVSIGKVHYLWRMAMGADNLYTHEQWSNGGQPPDIRDSAKWRRHQRGHSDVFSTNVNNGVSLQPPGHEQGWSDMWRLLYQSIAGDLLRLWKHPCVPHLPPSWTLPVPMAEDAGRRTVMVVERGVQSFKEGGTEMLLS